jgi:signal transduction histidine kinase
VAADLVPGGEPRTVQTSRAGGPLRALETRLPWGETLIVQRDTRQLADLRSTILSALFVSGALILGLGAAGAVAFSLEPLARVQATQRAVDAIKAGDLTVRLPSDGRGDEIDELARIVNGMMDEVERLMLQARTVGEGVAHELRTPLTRLRATLDHAADSLAGDPRQALVERCIAESDALLARFRALLRIAAVEARGRRAGIGPVSLNSVLEQSFELYQPLAEARQVALTRVGSAEVEVLADAELLAELFSNLLDNALKFTPQGGSVEVCLHRHRETVVVSVRDTGPGISQDEQALVLGRFYRSQTTAGVPGHGLGLSLVAAIADLHGFELALRNAEPGLDVALSLPVHSRGA